MPVDRVDTMSRFYSLMPALENANEREFRDGAALAALSRTGGPLTDVERGRVLEAVETLRRDDAEILRFSILAESAMHQLGIVVSGIIIPGPEAFRCCRIRSAWSSSWKSCRWHSNASTISRGRSRSFGEIGGRVLEGTRNRHRRAAPSQGITRASRHCTEPRFEAGAVAAGGGERDVRIRCQEVAVNEMTARRVRSAALGRFLPHLLPDGHDHTATLLAFLRLHAGR